MQFVIHVLSPSPMLLPTLVVFLLLSSAIVAIGVGVISVADRKYNPGKYHFYSRCFEKKFGRSACAQEISRHLDAKEKRGRRRNRILSFVLLIWMIFSAIVCFMGIALENSVGDFLFSWIKSMGIASFFLLLAVGIAAFFLLFILFVVLYTFLLSMAILVSNGFKGIRRRFPSSAKIKRDASKNNDSAERTIET